MRAMIRNNSKISNEQRRELWEKENKLKYIKRQIKHWKKNKKQVKIVEEKQEATAEELVQQLPVRYLHVLKYQGLPRGEVMPLSEALMWSRRNKLMITNDARIFNYLHKEEIRTKLIPTKSLHYIFNAMSVQGYRTYEVFFVE